MRTVAIIALLSPLIALADENDAAKNDVALFQGNWQLISMVRDGQKESEEEVEKITLTIRDNTFVLRKDGKVVSEGTFTLDPAKRPKEVTETITTGPNKGKVFEAIYEIDEKEHRICFAASGKKRPTTFSSEPGSGQVFQVWRKERPKHVTNSIGMKFVRIPSGSFLMGSPNTEKGRGDDEILRKVTLTKELYFGAYTVTQEQWQTVMGSNPSYFSGKHLPVDRVSWEDCQDFCKKLAQMDKKLYRLPTEAEWEYACRAGSTTAFHFGETLSTDEANYNGMFVYGAGKKGIFRETTTPAGSFPPNAWGLHDMHGNVWQWCHDRHGSYQGKNVVDPQGPPSGSNRVLRGGSWGSNPIFCRSANRNFTAPSNRTEYCGLRVCFTDD